MPLTDEQAREILKRHAAIYGDARYEPASWVLDAMKEAASFGSQALGAIAVPEQQAQALQQVLPASSLATGVARVACEHKAGRMYPGGKCPMTGEPQPDVWIVEFTYRDLDVGRFECTQCREVFYYTGHWRNYHEHGIPCPGSEGVRRVPPKNASPPSPR